MVVVRGGVGLCDGDSFGVVYNGCDFDDIDVGRGGDVCGCDEAYNDWDFGDSNGGSGIDGGDCDDSVDSSGGVVGDMLFTTNFRNIQIMGLVKIMWFFCTSCLISPF